MTGIEMIAQERKEQIEKHHRSLKEDREMNTDCQLADAARLLLLETSYDINTDEDVVDFLIPKNWNKEIFLKMYRKSYKDRLVIAGALIAAELDRLNN